MSFGRAPISFLAELQPGEHPTPQAFARRGAQPRRPRSSAVARAGEGHDARLTTGYGSGTVPRRGIDGLLHSKVCGC